MNYVRSNEGHLRHATVDDIPALRELVEASVRTLSIGYISDEQIEAELRYVISLDSQIVRDGTYFVVVADNGALMGAGGWSSRRKIHGGDILTHTGKARPDEPLDPRTDPARIRQMFTHPSYARRGVARRIFEAARAEAAAHGFTRLILTATMAGVPLYRSLGFVVEREYMDVLPNNVDVPVAEMTRAI